MGKKFCEGLESVIRALGMFLHSDRVNMAESIWKEVSKFLDGEATWKDVTDTVLDEVKYYANDCWSDYASEQREAIRQIKGYIYDFVMSKEGIAA